jgi:hypothetical protein
MKSVMKKLPNVKNVKKFFLDKENVILVCLSVILLLLVLNYFGNNELFQDVPEDSKPTHVLVLFWVEWCPHCTKFIGTWQDMEKEKKIIKVGNKVVLIKNENCTGKESKLPKEKYNENVRGFPHISLHNNETLERVGKPYDGKRTESSILSWVKSILA